MLTTTEAKRKPSPERAKKTAEAAGTPPTARDVIAPPPKLRRRPLLVVASIAAVCLGALFGVWAYTSVSTAQEVVAVRSSVQRGGLISREDLVAVRIGVDPALSPIPATELDDVVGQRAAMSLCGPAIRCGWWRHRDSKVTSTKGNSGPSPPQWSGPTRTPIATRQW
jgi:hypothetical protein